MPEYQNVCFSVIVWHFPSARARGRNSCCSEACGTWLDSHFRRQIRTFWFGLLWISLCVVFIIATFGIGLLITWPPMIVLGLWFVYRIVRGWIALSDGRPM